MPPLFPRPELFRAGEPLSFQRINGPFSAASTKNYRERQRQTERQRDRETERQRDRETDRETERQRERERARARVSDLNLYTVPGLMRAASLLYSAGRRTTGRTAGTPTPRASCSSKLLQQQKQARAPSSASTPRTGPACRRRARTGRRATLSSATATGFCLSWSRGRASMAGACVAATDTFSCAGRTAWPLGGRRCALTSRSKAAPQQPAPPSATRPRFWTFRRCLRPACLGSTLRPTS